VRMQLQDFADQMLAGPYNKLMGQVASDIEYERARGLSESEQQLRMQHFLRMGRFFLAYMRYSGRFETSAESEEGVFKDSPFALVSETVDQRCFKLVRQAWTEATRTKGQFQMQGFGLSMLKVGAAAPCCLACHRNALLAEIQGLSGERLRMLCRKCCMSWIRPSSTARTWTRRSRTSWLWRCSLTRRTRECCA
jgi:hypothetical protein